MIRHVVCFKLKDPTEPMLQKTRDLLLSMEGNVPMIRGIEVGIDRLGSERSYHIILQVLLDSFEDLAKYQDDLYHCGVVKKHMHAVRESSVSVDYELN